MKANRKFITTLTAAGLTLAVPFTGPAYILTEDIPNLGQNIVTAFNAVKSTAVQAEQYLVQVNQLKTQLDSYIQQMKDAMGLTEALKVYNEAQQTLAELQSLQAQFTGNGGSLQSYLNQFQDTDYWMRTNPSQYGFNTTPSALQKQADDAWVRSLAAQQHQLQQDAALLERQQTASADAGGMMQALQTQAQIAGNEAKQLMEIRALMISEQNALAVRQQTVANQEAMKDAASKKYDTWNYQPASKISY